MPITYTLDRVKAEALAYHLNCPENSSEQGLRECLATHLEFRYEDYLGAWEIRTGRPRTDMTREEALKLLEKHPSLQGNPSVLYKLQNVNK